MVHADALFLVLMLGLFGVSALHQLHVVEIPGLPAMLLLDVAVLLVSLKLILMISSQDKSADFQFWLLNSIDYQVHTLGTRIRELEKRLEETPRREA